jgi:regulator of protease activity HflC (stomatin/prohibitin superfamily)
MTVQAQPVAERPAWFLPGLRMAVLGIVGVLGGWGLVYVVTHLSGLAAFCMGLLSALVLLAGVLILRGLTPVSPGHARVVQLFGRYCGTIRDTGLKWVNPFAGRIVVSTRIRNQESAQLKVNDADGNPIEIAAVVVWQIRDTANAIYSVDEAAKFVTIQMETAVRHTASSYPYDNRGTDRLSLRDNAGEITGKLSAELTNRVAPAGVQIVETRLTRLSYAPEIAQTMLRQQHPARSSARGPASSRARSAWSRWPCSVWRTREWCSSTRNARPPWSPTCSWCCAVSKPLSRW